MRIKTPEFLTAYPYPDTEMGEKSQRSLMPCREFPICRTVMQFPLHDCYAVHL